jgi:hypothetical protein
MVEVRADIIGKLDRTSRRSKPKIMTQAMRE